MDKKKIILMVLSVVLVISSYSCICTFKNTSIVASGEVNLELYEELITHLVENGGGTMRDIDYIAVDASGFGIVSEQDKKLLGEYLKRHNKNIILGKFPMLNMEPFIDENGLLKGVFISPNNLKYNFNTVNLEISATRGSSSQVGYTVKATYKNNKWYIKYKNFFIS